MNRQTIALVVVVAIASALIGAFGISELSGEAGAAPGCPPKCPTPSPTAAPTPAPPQSREDQISIFTEVAPGADFAFGPGEYFTWWNSPMIAVNGSHYPPSTTFQFEGVFIQSASAICFRLFDLTAGAEVSGSEVCHEVGGPVRLRSGVNQLAADTHEYTVQAKCLANACSNAEILAARIIAEWTETDG